jgi:hypothetical protein
MARSDEEILMLLRGLVEDQKANNKTVVELDKKLDLHIQQTSYELKRINDQDEIQNHLLDKHIEGVNTLKAMHIAHVEENEKQFKKVDDEIEGLRKPADWIRTTTKIVLWLGSTAVAVTGLVEFIKWLKG